jgi:serine/threonine protein phosphatase PrpC
MSSVGDVFCTYNYDYLNIPLLATYKLPKNLTLLLGVQAGCFLIAKYTYETPSVLDEGYVSGEGYFDSSEFHPVDFGVSVGLRWLAVPELDFGIEVRYTHGITQTHNGIATATKYGESASGDTHAVIKIDERRFMIALSDGMGSGEYARKISESTISLLESFYRAKMPSELILSTVNKLLSFNREETFACVDIGIVNLDTGRTDVVKIGSPMGFILSGNTLRVLDSSSLPLGILDALRPDTATYALQAGDVLLFLSDGITSAFPSTADLYETLKHLPDTNPQQIADDLLSYALSLYGGTAKDDMTVLAVRLFKNTRGGLLS